MSKPDRANDPARRPDMSDVRAAWFSGKITTEEANDLTGTTDFNPKVHPHNKSSTPTDHDLDHYAYYTHKRAGLN